jgi:hypothetical protein
LQIVGQRLEALHRLELLARADLLGAFVAGGLFQQIGRPTSPTKRKSPVKTPIGLSAPAVSVIMKAMCSGVWPGVCITSTLMLPTFQLSPSRTRITLGSSA